VDETQRLNSKGTGLASWVTLHSTYLLLGHPVGDPIIGPSYTTPHHCTLL